MTTVRELHERMTSTIQVLDHGLVSLTDSMGSDLAIVNAAQSSFSRESSEYGERERSILRSLMREEHGVPFEAVVLKYRIRLPIFVARQFVKHRMSSWSEHSGRYSAIERMFYIPEAVRGQVGKPMDYSFVELPTWTAETFRRDLRESCHRAFNQYERALANGIAREQARLILPANTYTVCTWTMNGRALMNFLRLRADSHAQQEARVYAEAMENLAATVIPDTIAAFVAAGRPKP